ncbi:hypothetical protein BN7_683 [Wickerhamomyces ciferrii]|uniref:Uncharacterized protein n=1 Tax=Wickerhamomyces ciferrii (strain ATCC 14091 / BCRC 22168 / CBS 111 / JCM 3599 / NBRC 0793 / NRRL Y-1031 F-60-10) TaxID=1206466 RepID=K0KDZ1_WICCF|nr:uncharacterized protein BN7_683 [Wickerhamomyces ciferrii]CCH41146.1 hypothetical protein BN7_683 [Wickerhamomyces ciferrii]
MRYSYRILVASLLLILGFSIFKFKEFRDQEVIERDDLLNRYQTNQQNSLQLEKDINDLRINEKFLISKLKLNEEKLVESTKQLSINQDKVNQLNILSEGTRYEVVNSQYKKWNFIKESPSYQKVTYLKTGFDTSINDLIVLSVIGHGESYGPTRSFADYLDVIHSMKYDWNRATLGLLIGKKEEYDNIINYLNKFESEDSFSKIIVIHAEYIEKVGAQLSRDQRHADNVQKERRRTISKSRNFLVNNAIEDEAYTLFLDSDMVKVPTDMIKTFLNTDKDVIVPRIAKGTTIENYDFNSWRGTRIKPTKEQEDLLDKDPNFVFVPKPDQADHMHDLAHKTQEYNHKGEESFIVELDSVGGAVLFLKSEIFKQGIMFPTNYIIGTTWDREGYDGIETEGLCYQANIIGYHCWGMPNYVAYHVDENVIGG